MLELPGGPIVVVVGFSVLLEDGHVKLLFSVINLKLHCSLSQKYVFVLLILGMP